ncbi:MAG: Gfo/Idh/MocA family oxidoreductase [Fimbriimonadaceae bacterium]|nr:Gfo/Idh/MocA family oxidoreductase [Fimbriimonadaceae bacterium]
MQQVRLGLIGCGGMGKALCDQAVTLPGVCVTAVSDVDAERCAEAAGKYSATAVADYADLVTRGDVDAVVVATPGGLHRPPVEAAAAAGKHVFSEKPLAATVADCDAMIAAVEAAGVKSMVGQVCRWHPTHRMLHKMVQGWPLGAVRSIYVERLGSGWGANSAPWRYSRELSGGTLLEVNAHELDFMLWVAGPVKRVMAVGGQMVDLRSDYPDCTWVSLAFESGAVGVLQSTGVTTLPSYAARLDCEHGSATAASFFGGEITYKLWEPGAETQTLKPDKVETPVLGEMRAFVTAIRDDTATAVPFREARRTVAVVEAAYHSIATGQAVEL